MRARSVVMFPRQAVGRAFPAWTEPGSHPLGRQSVSLIRSHPRLRVAGRQLKRWAPRAALAIGLVNRLCAESEVDSAALEFAAEVAKKAGRIGVTSAKRAVFTAGELPLAGALEVDGILHWDTMRRGNFLRGVEAFTSQHASKAAH